jgi:hypothetical protein
MVVQDSRSPRTLKDCGSRVQDQGGAPEVGLQSGQLLVGQAVGAAGQPVSQLPLAIALAATPSHDLDGDPAGLGYPTPWPRCSGVSLPS